MYTRKDVAREAGVSQATVSNVLNGKGNVSLEKIRLVTEAAQRLGYSINAQARQLRRDVKLSDIVAVLIPALENSEFTMLYTAINKSLDDTGFRPALFTTGGSPAQERHLVQSLATMRVAGVITVSSLYDSQDTYCAITNYGGRVVHVLCQPKYTADYIGFDFEQAGKQIAASIHLQNPRQILILSGLTTLQMENQFVNSITQALPETTPTSILHACNDTASQVVLQYLSRASCPDVLIASSETLLEQAKIALNLHGVSSKVTCYSLAPRKILPKDSSENLFLFDYYELGVQAAERLLFCIQNPKDATPLQKTISPVGFPQAKPLSRRNSPVCLRVLMMKGQCSSAIMSLTPSFSRQTNISISYTTLSPHEMDEIYSHPEILESFDVFRIGSSRLPYFPKQHLLPFRQDLHASLTEGMPANLVQLLSVVNTVPYGVPFEVGIQVMVYRKDLFNDAMLKRMYFESCGKNLEVPQDFESYLQICRFFDQRKNTLSPVVCGTSGSFGTDAEMFAEFYDRYQSAATTPLVCDGSVCFDCQAAQWAIENYIETMKSSSFILDGQYYGSNLESFSAGKTAMEQIAVNYSSNIIHLRGTNVDSKIGYADVPGRYPALGGGVLSISKNCKEPEAALAYIRWACGVDTAEQYTYLGGVSPYMSVYTNPEILSLYPWYRLIPPKFQKPVSHLWDKFHAGKLEHLVGYLLRSVYHGILSSTQASTILQQQISECMLPDSEG